MELLVGRLGSCRKKAASRDEAASGFGTLRITGHWPALRVPSPDALTSPLPLGSDSTEIASVRARRSSTFLSHRRPRGSGEMPSVRTATTLFVPFCRRCGLEADHGPNQRSLLDPRRQHAGGSYGCGKSKPELVFDFGPHSGLPACKVSQRRPQALSALNPSRPIPPPSHSDLLPPNRTVANC